MLPRSDGDLSRFNLYEDGQEITDDIMAGRDNICTYTVNGKEKECDIGQLNSMFMIDDDEEIYKELKNGNDVDVEIEYHGSLKIKAKAERDAIDQELEAQEANPEIQPQTQKIKY